MIDNLIIFDLVYHMYFSNLCGGFYGLLWMAVLYCFVFTHEACVCCAYRGRMPLVRLDYAVLQFGRLQSVVVWCFELISKRFFK